MPFPIDYQCMRGTKTTGCARYREAISARIDGEAVPPLAVPIDVHLQRCADCRAFVAGSEALDHSLRLAPAVITPDVTTAVLHELGGETGRPERAARVALAVVAFVQIALALPALLLGDDAGLPIHAAHHLGSFDVALAVGFLFAAWRPVYVRGLLPVATALVACIVTTSVLDIVNGGTSPLRELHHVPEILALACAYLLARPYRLTRAAVARA